MKVETLIYIYMFICISLMVFNVVYILIMKRVDKRIESNTDMYWEEISNQLDLIHSGLCVTENHKKLLNKKLKNISHLTAFDKSLEVLYNTRSEDTQRYLGEIYPVFVYLSCEYEKKDKVKTAYLPYIISKYNLLKSQNPTIIIDNLMSLLRLSNVYLRENAMKAIYSTGNSEYAEKALRIIDSENNFHHSKLICDGLMAFNGDKSELAERLWDSFEDFSYKMQINILNFVRFAGIRNDKRMLNIIENEDSYKENRLAAIRYFEKFYCKDAQNILHKFARNDCEYDWEYQAIASSALKTYPGDETEEILKKNLSNSNWHIRYNSAESCEKLGLTYVDLISIFNGKDRYAREMAQYRFDRKAAQEEVVVN